jgi:hypothetical protein
MRYLNLFASACVVVVSLALTGCSATSAPVTCDAAAESESGDGVQGASETFTAEVWADNWFALYANGAIVGEDVVPITTERSFNAQCITFTASYPVTIGLVSKDFVEDESGLEYIGESNQQMGDGGIIVQIKDSSGAVIAATDSTWRGLSIFRAPLNEDCVSSSDPLSACQSEVTPEPEAWTSPDFDDSTWSPAVEYTEGEVNAKDGYTQITWDQSAHLIWASDLHIDNTILWRYTITG